MRPLFISPHNDDETLFGAYTLMRHKPDVVVCLWGMTQPGITGTERLRETERALKILGIENFSQWGISDARPEWETIVCDLRQLGPRELVFAPAVELGGHDHHNMLGDIADRVFGPDCVTHYATYVRESARTRTDNEVPYEPTWPARKLRAMACYTSQINLDNTRPWFSDWDREWYE